jgi:WD40 repeat protein
MGKFPAGHRGVFGLAFSPDGRTLASAGLGNQIRLWDLATQQETARFAVTLKPITFLAFTPNGKTLVAGDGSNPLIELVDARSGQSIHQLRGVAAPGCFALSPDGRTLATGSQETKVCLWDLATGKPLPSIKATQLMVTAVAISPDSKTLAWSEGDGWGADCPIHLWDLATGKEVARWQGHGNWTETLVFSEDGRTLFTGVRNGFIGRWDVAAGKEIPLPGENRYAISSFSFSPKGRTLAVRTSHQLRFWDMTTGQALGIVPQYQPLTAAAFSPDGQILALGGKDHTVSLWELRSGRCIGRLDPKQKPDPAALGCAPPDPSVLEIVRAVAFSADSKKLACGGWDTIARVWDLETGKEVRRFSWPRQRIEGLAISADATILAAATTIPTEKNHSLRFWDIATGKELPGLSALLDAPLRMDPADQPGRGLRSLPIFSPDGRLVVRIRPERSLPVWELATGKKRFRLRGHEGVISAATFSPDGRLLASAAWDNTIRLWDLDTGKELSKFTGHRGRATCLAFSADGKILVSGGNDTTVLVWDVTRFAHKAKTARNEPGRFRALAKGGSGGN